ncbi:MAG: ATP-binding cassette domain-containing protein [Chitinophagaceae bacterium]
MLELATIHKSFGDHTVLSVGPRRLPPGVYWLRGANGSGKSTLLNILAGLLPFKGDIILNETISIHRHPVAYRQLVNHAPAEPVFPAFLTGTSLVQFARSIKKGNTGQLRQVQETLGIGDYLANPTGSYSSGMLKKLSLLLAFTGRPAWVLLDEPFTTLDQASQQALTRVIRAQHSRDISFIITSHHDIPPADLAFSGVFTVRDKQLQDG